MRPEEPGDLSYPDGSRLMVWTRRGRVRVAVVGATLAIAAGGAGTLQPNLPDVASRPNDVQTDSQSK
jgi:hypothetical protein